MRKIVFTLTLILLSGLVFCQTAPVKKVKSKKDTVKKEDKPERRLFAVKFYSIFKEEPNGDITALYPIKINYYTINPGGSFPIDGSIGGVSLSDIKGHNLLIDTINGVVIYKGVYH